MKQKTYLQTIAGIFSVIAIAHALRLLNSWPINIGGFEVPIWVSWLGAALAAFLAYNAFKFVDKR